MLSRKRAGRQSAAGLGRSDKPEDPAGYSSRNFGMDAVAIPGHLEIPRDHAPERVASLVLGCSNQAQSHGVKREGTRDRLTTKKNSYGFRLLRLPEACDRTKRRRQPLQDAQQLLNPVG